MLSTSSRIKCYRGGGTDAAFAALHTKAPVIERFGLQGMALTPLRQNTCCSSRLNLGCICSRG